MKYKYQVVLEIPVDGEVEADNETDAMYLAEEQAHMTHGGYIGSCEVTPIE